MKQIALPAFADTYIWMLHDARHAFVVDPGDAAPVEAALDAGNLSLDGILVMHPHAHHVSGVIAGRRQGAPNDSPVAVFAARRKWKNRIR